MVFNFGKTVLIGNVACPSFDGGAFDFDGPAAVAADEMVVVAH